MRSITSNIKNIISVIALAILISSCNTYKSSLSGKYVNTNNVWNEYFIFNKEQGTFKYESSKFTSSGLFYKTKEYLLFKSDSLEYLNNLDINFKEKSGVEDDKLIVEVDSSSFKNFRKSYPDVKLFFLSFTPGLDNEFNPTSIFEITSVYNEHKLSDFASSIGYFKIIGLRDRCYRYTTSNDCNELFEIVFKSKFHDLRSSYWTPIIEIDLNSLMDLDLNNLRFLKITEYSQSQESFQLDGKTFKKFND